MEHCPKCMHQVSADKLICPFCGYDRENTIERFDQLPEGHVLGGRYTLGVALGRGGFGITYAAWDERLTRGVAIKEFLPNGIARRSTDDITVKNDVKSNDIFVKGIKKTLFESRKLAEFSNVDGVVNVIDCFEENGTAYIVMELLEGQNVKQYIKDKGKLDFDETLKIITPVLKTLSVVHKANLIHRDISPDNIFLCSDGRVKLLDFGSARIVKDDDETSRSIILKHGYAPKEQYSSRGKQGTYTDMYAVAATIYKMLTGITPEESIERITGEDELQDISELVKIPQPAAYAIMQGLEIKEKDRIQTADEFLQKLTEEEKPFYQGDETVTMTADDIKERYGNALEASEVTEILKTPENHLPIREFNEDEEISEHIFAEEQIVEEMPEKPQEKSRLLIQTFNNESDENKEITKHIYKEPANDKTTGRNQSLIRTIQEKNKKMNEEISVEDDENVSTEEEDAVYEKLISKRKKIAALIFIAFLIAVIIIAFATQDSASDVYYSTVDVNVDEVGDIIYFGSYEQDNDESNGKEEIKWRVLEKKDDKLLVISEYGLDSQPYNTERKEVTWETCSLRKWLNDDFLNNAFDKEEQKKIQITNVTADDNPVYDTDPGNDTKDKVFLLSITEAEKYSSSDKDIKCVPTDYVIAQGGFHCWWLRSPGQVQCGVAYVDHSGMIREYGYYDDCDNMSVRPAMWISTNS